MVAERAGSDDRRTVTFWPRGASAELFRDHGPEVVVSGPAGTGKTYCALWRLHLAALKYPGMRGIMLRKTLEALTASALVTWQNRVLRSGNFGVRPFGGSKLKPAGFQYPNGSEILIGGLDKANKVMSQEYDLIYVNEAPELTEEDWESLTTRARYGVMPYQQVFGDCNPQGPGHWLYKRANDGRTTMLFSTHQDNPALWDGIDWTEAGRAYISRLEALTGFRRDRLLLGKWTAAEGAVYPAFDRQTNVKHLTAEELEGWGRILAMDVGTRNPTVILPIYHSGDRRHVPEELHERGMSTDSMTDAALRMWEKHNPEFLVIDPSAAGLIVALQNRGLRVRKAVNDILIGLAAVTAVLPDTTIDPSCEKFIAEMETYRYPDGRRGNVDVPLKENDHSPDAYRYGTMELDRPRKRIGML